MSLIYLIEDNPVLTHCGVEQNEPLWSHVGFRTGGNCEVFLEPENEDNFVRVLNILRNSGEKYFVLGKGTNTLVPDDGFPGAVISTRKALSGFEDSGADYFWAGGGCLLSDACRHAAERSISGMEKLYGIPGTVGGAVFMNAGAYGTETKDVVSRVRVLDPTGHIKVLSGEECGFAYRKSIFQDDGTVVLAAEFRGTPGVREDIEKVMDECMAARKSTQPLEYPSCGSFFKRPQNGHASRMIDEAGMKGKKVGGAQVSPKHAGFIVNTGGATTSDIMKLASMVKEAVKKKFGVELEMEVRLIG
ncbi:MAG: UDP-N-acetylmuramate dehydrogenase [Oscillospiraceae bacterium]